MRTTILAATLLSLAAGLLIAGPLTPPAGTVASTYKTLGEVEPRIPINAANTPGDATSLYRITAPGSYYLTGNIFGAAGKHGIVIATNNVTIDLAGFSVLGTATSLNGITLSGARSSIVVRNGSITGWAGDGLNLFAGRGILIEDIVSNSNASWGIISGVASNIRHCSASQNGTGFASDGGIGCDEKSLVESCTADANNGTGLAFGTGGTLQNCTSTRNTVTGINGGYECTVTGCTVEGGVRGIEVYLGSTVSDCRVFEVSLNAITAADGCEVRNNHCFASAPTTGSRGIYIQGSDARVESNVCSGFEIGFSTSGTHTFFSRNTARNNTTNWIIPAANTCYVVSANAGTAINGNNGGISAGSNDPNANFTY